MINPVSTWASSYESIMNQVFSDAALPGFNAVTAIQDAWQKFMFDNSSGIQTIAPLAAPVTLSGTATKTNFAPVMFSTPGTPDLAALVLSSAFAAYAGSITWIPPPPAPPFSVLSSVITNAGSVAAAQATLYAGLMAEFAIIPPPGGAQAKYTAIATLFFTAISSLTVDFIGIAIAGAPPPPLTIPMIPVF